MNSELYTYSRSDNPTRKLLETNLAILEKAKYGLSFSSGLGVLTCLSHLDIFDNGVIASHDLYGGTKRFFNEVLSKEIKYLDFSGLSNDQIGNIFNNTTINIVWIETPSNPLLETLDISRISRLCHKYKKYLVVDNTFLSPIFQNPLELGCDIVIHSITKYINGMSDVVMGCMMTNNDFFYKKLKYLQNAMGIIPSPFDCYLVNRSIKTLPLRMSKHEDNAKKLVELLKVHPNIDKVIYPKKIPKQMKGCGGMISFYIKGDLSQTKSFLNNLKMIPLAESLGGVESLIEHPGLMTHASINEDERKKLGIADNLIRLSVGLENVEDIYKDIEQSLSFI